MNSALLEWFSKCWWKGWWWLFLFSLLFAFWLNINNLQIGSKVSWSKACSSCTWWRNLQLDANQLHVFELLLIKQSIQALLAYKRSFSLLFFASSTFFCSLWHHTVPRGESVFIAKKSGNFKPPQRQKISDLICEIGCVLPPFSNVVFTTWNEATSEHDKYHFLRMIYIAQ